MAQISGAFEIHLTVGAPHGAQLARFAERHGVKFVHIVLERGHNPSQPMLTLPVTGDLQQVRHAAAGWQQRLAEDGLVPARLKIEAAPWCDGVPRTDGEAAAEPQGRYFEHH